MIETENMELPSDTCQVMQSDEVVKDSHVVPSSHVPGPYCDDSQNSGSDIEVLDRDSSDCSVEMLKTGDSNLQILQSNNSQRDKSMHHDVNEHSESSARKGLENLQTADQNPKIISPLNKPVNITNEKDNVMYASYREISSDNDSDNDVTVRDDVTDKIDDDSSTSSVSQISPNHRIQYRDSDDTSDCNHSNSDLLSSPPHTRTSNSKYCKQSQASDTEKLLSADDEEEDVNGDPKRPGSLSLPRPLQYYERHKTHRREASNSSLSGVSQSSSTDVLIEEASKTPLHKQGSVTREGDMIAFVADGLNDMIKMSSPLSRTSGSMSGSMQSPLSVSSDSISAASDVTSSASEWSRDYSRMSRSPSILTASPDDIPPVDPRAFMDVELHARRVANSLDHMMGTMQNNLHKMSALSYHCLDAYKDGVDNTCNSVDASIKAMYALMAKSEELSKAMEPTYTLHGEIKEIQRLLDKFELQMVRQDK